MNLEVSRDSARESRAVLLEAVAAYFLLSLSPPPALAVSHGRQGPPSMLLCQTLTLCGGCMRGVTCPIKSLKPTVQFTAFSNALCRLFQLLMSRDKRPCVCTF